MNGARKRGWKVTIPANVVDAIDRYNATDWKDGRDPSKIGALNAVAWIGEALASLRGKKGKKT